MTLIRGRSLNSLPNSKWLLIAGVALLAGCMMGPDYRKPEVAAPTDCVVLLSGANGAGEQQVARL